MTTCPRICRCSSLEHPPRNDLGPVVKDPAERIATVMRIPASSNYEIYQFLGHDRIREVIYLALLPRRGAWPTAKRSFASSARWRGRPPAGEPGAHLVDNGGRLDEASVGDPPHRPQPAEKLAAVLTAA